MSSSTSLVGVLLWLGVGEILLIEILSAEPLLLIDLSLLLDLIVLAVLGSRGFQRCLLRGVIAVLVGPILLIGLDVPLVLGGEVGLDDE